MTTTEPTTHEPTKLELLTHDMLAAIQYAFDRYVVFPSEEARDSVVLWAAHTWVYREFETTPRLSIRSTEYGSGKSLVLDILDEICLKAEKGINLTPGTMWRLLGAGDVTILYDEVDTVFGKRGSSSSHQERRAVMNEGHKSNGTVLRCVGSEDVKHFNVFAPMALAGVGRLPASIASRSVEIIMRRKRAGDPKVQPFRLKFAKDVLDRARRLCEHWADKAMFELRMAMPELPDEIQNRAADVWEPLIAIADLAGPEWAERARKAAVTLTQEANEEPPSIGVQLLTDLRQIFGEHESLWTHEILGQLVAMKDRPWTPRTMNPRTLAKLVGEYGAAPEMIRRGDRTARGYYRDNFEQAWQWYLDEM